MLNHCLKDDEEVGFVLNFKSNDSIITKPEDVVPAGYLSVSYADGHTQSILDTESSRSGLINKMMGQLVDAEFKLREYNLLLDKYDELRVCDLLLFSTDMIWFLTTYCNSDITMNIFMGMTAVVWTLSFIGNQKKKNKYRKLIDDVEKNLLYLDHEIELSGFTCYDEDYLLLVRKNFSETAQRILFEGKLSINTLDYFTYDEIKYLCEYIDSIGQKGDDIPPKQYIFK